MAHGLECKRCGHQEAAHDYPNNYPRVCGCYVSPDKRFENRMWKAEREAEAEEQARKYRGIAYEH
jgi:hypothetical protein